MESARRLRPQDRALPDHSLSALRSAARDGTQDDEWFLSASDSLGQRRVGRIVRQVLLARKKSKKRTTLQCSMVADGALQHGIARLDGIEDGACRDRVGYLDFQVARDTCEVAQVKRKYDSYFAHV